MKFFANNVRKIGWLNAHTVGVVFIF